MSPYVTTATSATRRVCAFDELGAGVAAEDVACESGGIYYPRRKLEKEKV